MKAGLKGTMLVGGAAVVLLLAGGLQFSAPAPLAPANQARVAGELADLLPRSFTTGWSGRDLPLGESELTKQRTEGLLQFDDYVYREFSRGSTAFAIYAAYWQPGKMPTRLVSLHTPDRCWTENGWTCLVSRNREPFFDAPAMPLAEWRVFTPPGDSSKVYTVFWLLVDGRTYDFGRGMNKIPNPITWWRGVLAEAGGAHASHLFVRLTSNRPFEDLQNDPAWPEVVAALAKLGLEADGGRQKTEG